MLTRPATGRTSPLQRLVLVAAAALGGCSLLVTTSGLSGSAEDGGATPSGAEAGDSAFVIDAGDASPFVPCTPDGAAAPLRVFDPLAGQADATAPCNAGNLLATDGKGVGLDVLDYGQFVTLAGETVTGCIAVEFAVPLTSITVRMRAVANACGRACAAGLCGQGRFAAAFLGATRATLRSTGNDINMDDVFHDYPVQALTTDRVVVICRFANSADKDDIEVDSIVGGCNP
jgi:hypothetical protein